jgi:hypothetical protein
MTRHLPGQMLSGIAGEEDYHASGIVRLIEFLPLPTARCRRAKISSVGCKSSVVFAHYL